jgi:nitroreductase
MDVIKALHARRAVKHFDPDHIIPDETVLQLLEATMLSPTAFNIQHWRFVWVQDPALRQEIRKAAWDQEKVTDASALFVLTADLDAWQRGERYWDGAPEPVVEFMLPAIRAYYENKPQVERDECMRSMGLAAMSMMLAAKDLDLDTCPMDGFDYEAVGRLINLPERHIVGLMIAVGRKAKDAWPRLGKLALEEILVMNRFET